MSPADVAKRIAALDWSGVSLQHQLAVSAAVETLSGKATPMTTYTTFEDIMPADRTELYKVAAERIEREANVIPLPVRPRTCWTTLCHLDGREWARSSHFGPGGAWNWILDCVGAEHRVSEDQISCIESGEDDPYDCDDLVTVDGLPLYRIQHLC